MSTVQLLREVEASRQLPSPPIRKAIRESAHVSQGRMGEALGVHPVTVMRWERGQCVPRGENLVAYVELLQQLGE